MTTRVLGIYSHINDHIIGYDGKLLFTHPEDFKHFKEITMGKTLLVGYKTAKEIFERNPNGLQDRKIAILIDPTRDIPNDNWMDLVDTVSDPLKYITESKEPIVVAGGEWVFNKLWCHVTQWHITHFKINIDELFYTHDETLVSRFIVPDLTQVVEEKSFTITLPNGEEREVTIAAHLI